MKRGQSIIAALVVAAALAAAVLLLPRFERGPRADREAASRYVVLARPQGEDAAALGGRDSFAFVPFVRSAGEIRRGDTLGYLYATESRDLRDYLRSIVERGVVGQMRADLPPEIAAELESMRARPSPGPTPPPRATTRERLVVRGFERDLLESELMGAEDGLRDYARRLAAASGDNPDAEELARLRTEVERRRGAIARLKAKLGARERVDGGPTKVAATPRPTTIELNQRQRARLLSLSESLPIDPSSPVVAQIAGRYEPSCPTGCDVAHGDTLGVISRDTVGRSTSAVGAGEESYLLIPRGSPVLLATATRVDSFRQGERGLRIRPSDGWRSLQSE